jgi:hypothetical protein
MAIDACSVPLGAGTNHKLAFDREMNVFEEVFSIGDQFDVLSISGATGCE